IPPRRMLDLGRGRDRLPVHGTVAVMEYFRSAGDGSAPRGEGEGCARAPVVALALFRIVGQDAARSGARRVVRPGRGGRGLSRAEVTGGRVPTAGAIHELQPRQDGGAVAAAGRGFVFGRDG